MTTPTDYRTLLADAYQVWVRYPEEVRGMSFQDILLATRIPGLPIEATFADLLRWGENVAKLQSGVVAMTYASHCNRNTDPDVYAERLLAALRTEADR